MWPHELKKLAVDCMPMLTGGAHFQVHRRAAVNKKTGIQLHAPLSAWGKYILREGKKKKKQKGC